MPRKKKSETEKAETKKEEKTIEAKEEKSEMEEKIEIKKITKKDLLERAKKLAEVVEEKKIDLKEKLVESKKKITLVPLEDYVKYQVCMGTKIILPGMRKYVYKRRADGIAVINTNLIDEKLKEAVEFLSKYNPEQFIVVCKRNAGWKAVELFGKLTGVKVFTKKYPAGIITNIILPNFFEPDMVFICDPWMDRNALKDAIITKKKVLALVDTNNYMFGIEKFVPCNNKISKSIGFIFYIIAREYLKAKGIQKELPPIEEWTGEKN
ncbi:30S ribosomal protein S2 [Candidatus Bathyarchaeota archaeon]|nr:30S ribosomal protein S2 [Candidatus Bathyarchaeota archaeon]